MKHKALISSSKLYDALNEYEDLGSLYEARFIDDRFAIRDFISNIAVDCDLNGATAWIPQQGVNWNDIKDTLKKLKEQPIILSLGVNKCSITLEF